MTAQTRTQLYQYFLTNEKPTQAQFQNLIDSSLNIADASAQAIVSDVSCMGSLDVSGTFTVSGAAILGTPLGGNQGSGTLNAVALYVNGSAVSTGGNGGTVNTGTANQLAYYATSTNAVSGTNAIPNGTTATTQAVNDSSTKVATTGFANPANSIGTNGYNELPSGLIIQWGTNNTNSGNPVTFSFPTQFSTACYSFTATVNQGDGKRSACVGGFTTSGATVYTGEGNVGNETLTFYWMAIGK